MINYSTYPRNRTPQDVWLNGASMRGASDKIHSIQLIDNTDAQEIDAGGYGGRDGSLVVSRRVKSRTVKIQFGLRGIYDTADRVRALDQINAWATDGILTWSEKPGQQLAVICTHPAGIDNVFTADTTYSIEFTAYAVPYWQDVAPHSVSITGSSASASMMVPGSVATVLDATITPATTISSLTVSVISAGKTSSLAFTALSTSSVIKIAHVDGILTLKAGNTDISGKRTLNSDDELFVYPGKTATVSVTASSSVTAVVSARGLYK